jgi:putative tricarboxylic transport membrane protein
MGKNKQLIGDLIMWTILFVSGLVGTLAVRFGSLGGSANLRAGLSPSFFPRLALGCLAGLSLAMALSTLKSLYSGKTECNHEGKDDPVDLRQVAMVMLATLAYVNLMDIIGYYAATFAFLVIVSSLLGIRKLGSLLLMPSIVVLSVFLLFEKALTIQLPRGSLF